MTVMLGTERPFSGNPAGQGELGRAPAGVVAQSVNLFDVGATPLTTVTATIHCASIMAPLNQLVTNLGVIVTTAGTVTGFWLALLDAGLTVRAVSANTTAPTTGFFNMAVTGANSGKYTSAYAGLYYVALGTVSSAAPAVGAMAALPSVAAASGPPVYCGTSSTAATTTPPIVGSVLGALTGVASNEFYAQIS